MKNNVQARVSNRPIDFTAVRLDANSVRAILPSGDGKVDVAAWLSASSTKQALIVSRIDSDGSRSYKYFPVSHLAEDAEGKLHVKFEPWDADFPFRYFEDPQLDTFGADKARWLADWHTEKEWLNAIHKTKYSIGLISLIEQLDEHPVFAQDADLLTADERLIRRFRQRQRILAEPDLLILANDHWNFDVRGFNPGGNHGSFFRVSANATFMAAGGAMTGIRKGLVVEQPYDSLSFMPTVLRMMGKIDDNNEPIKDIRQRGFRRFPGRIVRELVAAN